MSSQGFSLNDACVATYVYQLPEELMGQWGGAGGAICEDHLAFLR